MQGGSCKNLDKELTDLEKREGGSGGEQEEGEGGRGGCQSLKVAVARVQDCAHSRRLLKAVLATQDQFVGL